MEKLSFRIALGILAVVMVVMILLNVQQARGLEPDVVVPMTNSRIAWSGAGYNGIYGR